MEGCYAASITNVSKKGAVVCAFTHGCFQPAGGCRRACVPVPVGKPKIDVPEIPAAQEMSEISANMSATDTCPLNGPRRPHVLVPPGPGFEPGTVVVLAQVAGAPEAGTVRCMVLRAKDARCHVKIVADSGTKGVLGGRATNARMWLNRSDHVERCLQLFDDPSWPRHGYRMHRAVPTNSAGLVTALARFELYVCWAGAASWASARGSWDCTIQDSTGMPVLEHDQDEYTITSNLCQSDATEEYSGEEKDDYGADGDFKQVECEHATKGVIVGAVRH